MHPWRSLVHPTAPSDVLAALTVPSCVPKTTRPGATAGGIAMRLSPGMTAAVRNGGRSRDAAKRTREGDPPNIGQLAVGWSRLVAASAAAGVTRPRANGPSRDERSGAKFSSIQKSAVQSTASEAAIHAARSIRVLPTTLTRLVGDLPP